MPDWTYHPLIVPMLARVPATRARDVLLGALGRIARAPRGPAIIAALGHMQPPLALRRSVLGIDFSTPIGLAAGMDPNALGTAALARFGLGFVELGPLTAQPYAGTPVERRLPQEALWQAAQEHGLENPGVHALVAQLEHLGSLPVPIALRLSYRPNASVDEATSERFGMIDLTSRYVSWFTLDVSPDDAQSWDHAALHQHITTVVDHSPRPVMLAIYPDLTPAELDAMIQLSSATGVRGIVVGGGVRQDDGARCGRTSGAPAYTATCHTIQALSHERGPDVVLVASDGVVEPAQALALLDAGADLVQLSAGFVVAGPGLPKRINEALTFRARLEPPPANTGWRWFALLGLGMIVGGALAWFVGATRVILPYDEAFVGFNRAAFDVVNPRLLPFMQHDRVTLAGTMLSIGILYLGLAWGGVRHGAHWARRTLLLSGAVGFSSLLLFLGFGYFDPLHALVTLLLLPFFLLGLRGRADHPPSVPVPDLHNDRAWRMAAWGQLLLVGLGVGLVMAGITIALVGCLTVFVPADLVYLRTRPEILRAASPRLVALIAHDRAGFGGALASNGVGVLAIGLWGIRRGARWVWWTTALAGIAGFWGAISTHIEVGYLDLVHLSPAFIAIAVFATSLALLWTYMCAPAPGA